MTPKNPENFSKIAWMGFEIFRDLYVESMAPIGQCVKTQDRSLIMLMDTPSHSHEASITVTCTLIALDVSISTMLITIDGARISQIVRRTLPLSVTYFVRTVSVCKIFLLAIARNQ